MLCKPFMPQLGGEYNVLMTSQEDGASLKAATLIKLDISRTPYTNISVFPVWLLNRKM